MVILSSKDIHDYLRHPKPMKRLYIMPLLDEEKQIDKGSVDLRLGFIFMPSKMIQSSKIDVVSKDDKEIARNSQEIFRLDIGDYLVMHPGSFILSSTLEYLRLPYDLMGYLSGRSSWGRLGIVIHATATHVHPGYTGNLTFEIANIGEIPVYLYPGLRIAQIVFHKLKTEEIITRKSKYYGELGPGYSKIFEDPEIIKLGKYIDEKNKERLE